MTEKEIQLLGFEKQEDGGIEVSDDDGGLWVEDEFYYYTYDIVDGFELISSSNNEVGEDGQWFVEIFNTEPSIRFTEFGEVQALINLLQNRIIKRQTMKQTAVEWFQEQIIKIVNGTCELSEIQIFEQAKEMEKEQCLNQNKTELNDALREFQKKYPSVTSGDLQTFILGWQAAQSNPI